MLIHFHEAKTKPAMIAGFVYFVVGLLYSLFLQPTAES
jgi:hypothetical protein